MINLSARMKRTLDQVDGLSAKFAPEMARMVQDVESQLRALSKEIERLEGELSDAKKLANQYKQESNQHRQASHDKGSEILALKAQMLEREEGLKQEVHKHRELAINSKVQEITQSIPKAEEIRSALNDEVGRIEKRFQQTMEAVAKTIINEIKKPKAIQIEVQRDENKLATGYTARAGEPKGEF